jgi:ribosomal protein L16 Arg81 hydroxylase
MEVTIKIPADTTAADQNVIVARVMGRIAQLADASGLTREELTEGTLVAQSSEQDWIVVKISCPFTESDFPGKVTDSLESIVKIDTPDEPKAELMIQIDFTPFFPSYGK